MYYSASMETEKSSSKVAMAKQKGEYCMKTRTRFLAGWVLLIFLLSLIPAIPAGATTSASCAEPIGQDISVMSFNVLDDCSADSNGNFKYEPPAKREKAIATMLKAYQPDIIGMQEAADGGASGVLDWCPALNADLKDIYASRSLKDDTGLAHTICRGLIIFYKKSRFTLLDSGAAGYSQPANSKRCYQWVKLKDKQTNVEFFVFNTHWHIDGNATLEENAKVRAVEMQELANKINSIAKNRHVFVTGDFNSSYVQKSSLGDAVNIAKFLEKTGLKDALIEAKDKCSIDGNGTKTVLQSDDAGLQKCVDHVVYPSNFYIPNKMERILSRTYSTMLSDHDAILVYFSYRMPSLSVTSQEGDLDAYCSNGAYYIDNLTKRTKDLSIEVQLPVGAIYSDEACTKAAGTTLTIKSEVSKTYRPENTYYIKFGGAVHPLYLRSCNSNTSATAVYVDPSLTDKATGSAGLYCDKWYCRSVTVGVNGFSTIQAAVDAAKDGYTVMVAPGTYYEDVSYTGKSLIFYGSNRNNIKALVLKDGQLTVNTARSYETYLSGSITFSFGDLQTGSLMVNGFHFINRTGTGQVRILGGNTNKTVDLRICNNLFNCYTDDAIYNGSAIHANTGLQKTGVIEDNYFHLTKVPSYTNESGNVINYTNRAITMRNMRNMTINANYFDGYTGSKISAFWLSSEVSSGYTTAGYGNIALTANRFENSTIGSININNVRDETNADVLIAGNSYGGAKLGINFSETAQQISKNLPTDKTKITFSVQSSDLPNLSVTPANDSGISTKEFTYFVSFRSENVNAVYAHSPVNGTSAAYKGSVPTKNATADKHYTFKEWVDADGTAVDLSNVTATTTVYASFAEASHMFAMQNQSEATCTESGYSGDRSCTLCGYRSEEGSVLPATGHSYTSEVTTAANCTEAGVKTYTCFKCSHTYTEAISAPGHTVVTDKAVAPTCTAAGLTEGKHCAVCNSVLVAQETVAALGHDYSYMSNKNGKHTGTCSRCDHDFTENHTFENGACFCGDTEITVDESIKLYHTLDLASDISITFAVPKTALSSYDSYYLECTLPEYAGNTQTGTSTVQIQPVVNGNYYYFTVTGITAVRMGDMVDAVLHMTKGTQTYISQTDSYSVATYAYGMLSSTTNAKMLTLCADLLRYGAEAQSFKKYRTDALVDAAMTDAHKAYLSDTESMSFAATDSTLNDLASPVIPWVGKTLDLGTKVGMKFVFNAKNYSGDIANLSMKVSYKGSNSEIKTVTLTNPAAYSAANSYYSFTFYGLLASELRTVVDVTIYEGETQLSQTLRYSAESYASKTTAGALADLCKALFAYSDSAKAYFD